MSTFQPRRSQKRVYMRNKSAANSAASSPPVPARISTMASRSSNGSLGVSSSASSASSRSISGRSRSTSARASCDRDRKSTRLNSSHQISSYAVFCLKKKKNNILHEPDEINGRIKRKGDNKQDDRNRRHMLTRHAIGVLKHCHHERDNPMYTPQYDSQ